ncbi:THUMP-like domain-containing protein [Myroides sp. LJL119]
MKQNLLSAEVQKFIQDHLGQKVESLALKKSPFPGIAMSELVVQIESKQKTKDKLPKWFATENILFPSKLSIEQTSSEPCAIYKANLVNGQSLIDLTGGFGVDSYYFCKNIKQVTHCEMQSDLSQIAAHNFQAMQISNITCLNVDSIAFLTENSQKWDYIYLDPARRSASQKKVFFLSDCTPNVIEHLDLLLQRSNNIIIKTAPLLDISKGLKELKFVKQIHIVALNNEVKELLWVIEKDYNYSPELIAVNLTAQKQDVFQVSLNQLCTSRYALPKKYLYEPNAAILKTGKFDCISSFYDVFKLHEHSQLFTSDQLVEFAGRRFEICNTMVYNKINAKAQLSNIKANITTRNFPLKVEEIRKKWKIKDGGDTYIFFTTNLEQEKIFIICKKIL